ncbi:MAG: WYL domain-containing protein [Clostridia bacterium]|nr:WYL domain-containing protein [Clostridia bacterium]
MDNLEPKKLALLRIAEILHKRTDADHVLTQAQIIDILNRDYGIDIKRKAVGENVACLRQVGMEIEQTRNGVYLAERTFDDAELRLLIDGVLSSRHIPERFTKDLIEKLCSLSSRHFKKSVKHVYSIKEWAKTDNKSLFYNIEIISEAIENGKKIKFNYSRYGVDKKLKVASEHIVSPYQMILKNQRYYLMSHSLKWDDITFFKLDHITSIEIIDEPLMPITRVKGYERGIDYSQLSTALPYFFAQKITTITCVIDDWVVDHIVEWFGSSASIEKQDEKYKVTLTAGCLAFKYWALQYINGVEVLSPRSLRDEIAQDIRNALKKYQ